MHALKTRYLTKIMPGRYIEISKLPEQHLPVYERMELHAKIHLAAGITKLVSDEVVSHQSAGLLWGLPWFGRDLRVHTIRETTDYHARSGFALHTFKVDPSCIRSMDGFTVTDLEQTVLDLAAISHPAEGLAYIDYARMRGATLESLRNAAQFRKGNGRTRVRKLIELSVKDAESAQESQCRYWLYKAGVYEVITQVNVRTELGHFRADMQVKGTPLLYEYDGKQKYRDNPDALYDEKEREDALRKLGFVVVRVTKRHLRNPE